MIYWHIYFPLVLHRLPHGVEAAGTEFSENKMRPVFFFSFLVCFCLFCIFFPRAYFRDKMMDVIFISEPICSAMHE